MAERVNIITILIKARGHGKSTDILGDAKKKVKGIIPVYQKKHPHKPIFIVDTMEAKMYEHIPILAGLRELIDFKTGIARIIDTDSDKLWKIINENVHDSLIIFEDATRFVEPVLSEVQKKIILDTKQKNNDIIFVFHSLDAVPNKMIRFSDWIILGKTNDVFNHTIKSKYPIPSLKERFERIKQEPNIYYKECFPIM